MRFDIKQATAILVTGFAVSVAIITFDALAVPVQHSERVSSDMTRACIQKSGHSTKLTISGTTAPSGQLAYGTVYEITCDTAVYIEWGDTSAPTADANSNYLPANVTRYYATGGGDASRYVAAVQVSGSGSCFIQECM